MYNIVGNWPIDEELLSVKPIATLRWNEMEWNKRREDTQEYLIIDWLTDYLSIYLSIYLSVFLYMQYAHIYLSDGRNCRTLHWTLSGNI